MCQQTPVFGNKLLFILVTAEMRISLCIALGATTIAGKMLLIYVCNVILVSILRPSCQNDKHIHRFRTNKDWLIHYL